MSARMESARRLSLLKKASQARVGRSVDDKWKLDEVVGIGGMATVYAATHELGHRAAIKVMHAGYADTPELVERFQREARTLAKLKHPNAVVVYDSGRLDLVEGAALDDPDRGGEPYVVMELLTGCDLSTYLRRHGTLSVERALRVGVVVLNVLEQAHRLGIVHRDIKPANIFLSANAGEVPADDGDVHVLDFGVARLLKERGAVVTETGTTLGTVAYMPPEQIRGKPVDGRADLFAVGATLFRALTRRPMYEAKDERELMAQMLSTPAPRLDEVAPKVSKVVGDVLELALKQDPDERYPNAATLRRDIEAVLRDDEPPFAARGEAIMIEDAVSTDADAGSTDAEGAEKGTRKLAAVEDASEAMTVVFRRAEAGDAKTQPIIVTSAGKSASDPPLPKPAASGEPSRPSAVSGMRPRVANDGGYDEIRDDSAGLWWKVALVFALGFIGFLVLRPLFDDSLIEPDFTRPVGADSSAVSSDAPAASGDVEPPLSVTVDAPAASGEPPVDPSASPSGSAAGAGSDGPSPRPRPGSVPTSKRPEPITIPSSLPTALPSTLPALPTSFPTAIPTGLFP